MSNDDRTLADYLAAAVSPALIMILVGSLVFFLVEVMYIGQYYGRLLWFVFFFIFGAVLVSRISMQSDISGRAGLYAVVLGGLMWLALFTYVKFPPGTWAAGLEWAVHLGFIFLIWWSAHRLTLDCTLLNDDEDASGAGLLDQAGLQNKANDEENADADDKSGNRRKKKKKDAAGIIAWWERYLTYREQRIRRPRKHGVWVVYFSLAALPLFGLGQALIPATDIGRRRYAFWLMCIYVASGLALLLTTTFLSLRRYLRQRKLQMPIAVSTTWMMLGTGLILVFLILGAMMPRPYPEYSVVNEIFHIGTSDQKASKWALKGDEPGKGEGKPGVKSAGERSKNGQATTRQTADSKGQGGKNESGTKGAGKNKSSGAGKQKSGDDSTQEGERSSKISSNGDRPKGSKSSKGHQPQSGKNSGSPHQQTQTAQIKATKQNESQPGNDSASRTSSPQNQSPSTPNWPDWLKSAGAFLKWIVLGIVILLLVFFVLKACLSFLANFTFWARNLLTFFQVFWQSLWARKQRVKKARVSEHQAHYKPFSEFRDPFLTGMADQMSSVELVRYSFAALEALGRERKLARPTGQTPLEYVRRIGSEFPELQRDALRLAKYYAKVAYAPSLLSADCEDALRQYWLTLADVGQHPLPAETVPV